jgi:Domain of unknown function (DUF1877)
VGICYVWYAAKDATLERIRREPALAWKLVAPDEPEMYERARSWWHRLVGRRGDLPLDAGEGEAVDIDKTWGGIDYLFNGPESAPGRPPLDFTRKGGLPVRGVEIGYGCPHILWAADVRSIHEALSRLPDEELRARYDGPRMLREGAIPEDIPEELETLVEFVAELRRGARAAVERGMGWLHCAM